MKKRLLIGTILAVLFLVCAVSAMAESGTYDGISWDITDGVLTLGNGGTQTLTYRESRHTTTGWPWRNYASQITSVKCSGTVKLQGSLAGFFYGLSKVTTIDTSGMVVSNVTSTNSMFYDCSALTSVDVSNFDLSNATSMLEMFRGCKKLESLDVSDWDVSNVQYISSIFRDCSVLTTLDVSDWNTGKMDGFVSMFEGCKELASLDVSRWDTSACTSLTEMFYCCESLTTIGSTRNWDTSKVTSMVDMCYRCFKLADLDVSQWDVSSLINLSGAFNGCSKPLIDISNWQPGQLIRVKEAFYGCQLPETLDLSSWDTSQLTSLEKMFYRTKGLKHLDVSGWDVSNVTNVQYMFNSTDLEELDLSDWNITDKLTDAGFMCQYSFDLKSVDLSGWNVSNVKHLSNFFDGCSSLKSVDLTGWNPSTATSFNSLFSGCYALTSIEGMSDWTTTNVTSLYQLFYDCYALTGVDLSQWDTSNVTSMGRVFTNCYVWNPIEVESWEVSAVTAMEDMFYNCRSITSLNLSHWRTGSLKKMSSMFCGCDLLESVNLSGWNVSQVTSLNSLFYGCKKLTQVDFSGWDTSGVNTMYSTFFNCPSLQTLDLSGWNTSSVTNMHGMFNSCSALRTLDISGFNTASVTDMADMYSFCKVLKEVNLGDEYQFQEDAWLPTPALDLDGVPYTGKWIRSDETYGPYTPGQLAENYTSSMAGKWVWQEVAGEYTIIFVSSNSEAVGSMPSVVVTASEDYTLPENKFAVFGHSFGYWDDGNGNQYQNKDVIPGDTYAGNDEVTLTAVFNDRDTSVQMQNGMFEFSIYGDEKAFFDGIPAGTSYYVSEKVPEDWVLIMQSNSAGVIYPLEEAEALFVNKYQPGIAMAQFVGRKLMDEQPADADSFSFELWEDNVLLQTKSVMEGGFVMFDAIQYDKHDAGLHEYVIKEVAGDDETVLYDGHEEIVMVQVTAVTENNGTTKVTAEVTYDDDNVIFNNWTKPGELRLQKLVDDVLSGHESDEFRFRIVLKQKDGLPLDDVLYVTFSP